MIVDHIDNWKRYSFGPTWELVFSFLEGLTPESEERRYDLDGDDVFAIVMSYPTKQETDANAVLEAHRKYVDIQMALVGSERLALYPAHSLNVKTPYNAERDVEFFTYEKSANIQLGMFPGTFACLLPQDAHMPQLATGNAGVEVKKVVVKIALDRLEI
jgi:YhcH/YjgK/YiaL family protein